MLVFAIYGNYYPKRIPKGRLFLLEYKKLHAQLYAFSYALYLVIIAFISIPYYRKSFNLSFNAK